MRRRDFLRLSASAAAAIAVSPTIGCSDRNPSSAPVPDLTVDPRASLYGRWVVRDGMPAFAYDADQEALAAAEWDPIIAPRTRRHWLMVGNRAIRLQAANDGTVALFDESYGLRWLVAPDPAGSGI